MLEVRNLCKSFGERPALQGLSLKVAEQEIYGLLGANGAGKTTLINIICQLITPDAGEITIGGRDYRSCGRDLIGIVPQENLLYRHLSCAENLAFFAALYGLRGPDIEKRIACCLQAVNLSDRRQTIAANLSGGMQRRLSIGIALLHDPQLIILDEPTTGLDIEARFELWALLQTLKQAGKTLLITTHLLEEAERLCDRLGILKQGRLIAEGTLKELQELFNGCQVLSMQVDPRDQERVGVIAQAHQFYFCPHHYRQQADTFTFGLPRSFTIAEVVALFPNINLKSISLEPVRLEHIYLDLHRDLCPQPEVP